MAVIGTLFKQQRLRGSVLDEYTKDGALKQVGFCLACLIAAEGLRA